MTDIRHRISSSHAIVGEGWQLLGDNTIVKAGDQHGEVSTLLSVDCHLPWRDVTEQMIGVTVRWNCEEVGDIDGHERIFRRRIHDVRIEHE